MDSDQANAGNKPKIRYEARQVKPYAGYGWILIEHDSTPGGRVVAVQLTQEDCERIAALLNVGEKKEGL
jgi:hypothetical protein